MNAAIVIARRELLSQHLAPGGAVVAAAFCLLGGLVHFVVGPQLAGQGFAPGRPASLSLFFEASLWLVFLVAPAASMRAFSDEIRLGTLETLFTAPVRDVEIVLGKFLGAIAFLAILLAPTLLFTIPLELHGRPDWGAIAAGYAGLLLVGAACAASGLFASSLTTSPVVAYLLTLFLWMFLVAATIGLPILGGIATGLAGTPDVAPAARRLLGAVESVGAVAGEVNPIARVRGFVTGLVDSFSVAYLALLAGFFLAATAEVLAIRRSA